MQVDHWPPLALQRLPQASRFIFFLPPHHLLLLMPCFYTRTSTVVVTTLFTLILLRAATTSMAAATSVAVIGSGAAGLATARAFAKAFASAGPLRLDVYEQGSSIGGVWDYAAHVKTKPMYNGLRTNLPKRLQTLKHVQSGGVLHIV